jgi:hypothetical protein
MQYITSAIAVLFYILTVSIVLRAIPFWYTALLLFGRPSFRTTWRMMDLDCLRAFHSPGGWRAHPLLSSGIYMGISLIIGTVWFITSWEILLSLSVHTFALAIAHLLLKGLPPSVFVLAASGSKADALFEILCVKLYPLCVTSLLQLDPKAQRYPALTRPDHAFGSTPRETLRNLSSFRTRNDSEWHSIVGELMTICPIIVIDTRLTTRATIEELEAVYPAHPRRSRSMYLPLRPNFSSEDLALMPDLSEHRYRWHNSSPCQKPQPQLAQGTARRGTLPERSQQIPC